MHSSTKHPSIAFLQILTATFGSVAWPYLAPVKNSRWYLTPFKSYRMLTTTQTHPRTDSGAYWKQPTSVRYRGVGGKHFLWWLMAKHRQLALSSSAAATPNWRHVDRCPRCMVGCWRRSATERYAVFIHWTIEYVVIVAIASLRPVERHSFCLSAIVSHLLSNSVFLYVTRPDV